MRFHVRYLDAAAMAVHETRLDAPDEAAARLRLQAEGRQVLALRPAFGWRLGERADGHRRSAAEIAIFCRELRALTSAGLSVVEALEALAAHQHTQRGAAGAPNAVSAQLLGRLRAGRSLSSAMGDVGGFPALLVASVQSSERTSNLADALDAYLRYDELVGALRRRIVSAALYPAIVVGLGLVIAVFLLWVVIPRFASLYGQMGQGVGSATAALLGLSRALRESPWIVPLGLALVAGLVLWLAQRGRMAAGLRFVATRVPALMRPARHFELARLFEALALLVKGGFSLHESMQLCQGIAASPAARERIERARQAIERGASVSDACTLADLTDEITQRLLRAGERGGDFGAVLQAISRRHATAFETIVERATRVVEPLLLLGVALLVGGMVVLLYMPIFDIASAIR